MPKTKRKVSWDVVRVVAVLSVVVGHVTRQGPVNHPELGPFAVYLPVLFGANTLLVVSAFFICVTVRRGRTRRWLGHRLARVLPPYVVAAVVTFLVLRAVAPEFGWWAPAGKDLVSNLLLVQAWSEDWKLIDGSYWTMPAQVLAFACAAFLAPRTWLRGRALLVLLWALIVLPVLLAMVIRRDPEGLFILRSAFDGLTLHRASLFGIGVVVYLWTEKRLSGRHVAAYCVATLAALEFHTESVDTPSTIAFGVALAALAAAAGGPDWNIGPLARPVTWLGGISFGIYLVHQELGYVLARLLVPLGVGATGRFLSCLAMAIGLGWLLTRVVEKPAHAWLTGGGPARLRGIATTVVRTMRDLPQTPQPQGPISGTSPVSAVAGPRPVSHASTAAAGPATSAGAVPARLNDA